MKLALALFAFCILASLAHAVEFQSPENAVPLVELYSSEGCSSCPPADEWMAALRQDSGLWKSFVPVEFHVDYWNRLGWSDPNSKAAFTGRQSEYAAEWSQPNVYTPAFVLNGREWRTGILQRRKVPQSPGTKAGILSITVKKDNVMEVAFTPAGSALEWTATAALLGNGLISKVMSGENSNRTLHHEFVVLQLQSGKMEKRGNRFVATLNVQPRLSVMPGSYSVAAWVSKPGQLTPVQAIGGDLPLVKE